MYAPKNPGALVQAADADPYRQGMYVARSKRDLYFINLNSKSDHNKMIKFADLNSDDWLGKIDCLQAEIDTAED